MSLQDFSARTGHFQTELCARASVLQPFDFLKMQVQIVLREATCSLIAMQHVFLPRVLLVGCLFAVSSAIPRWIFQDVLQLLHYFLMDKLGRLQHALVPLEQVKIAL